jgi:hypothetical protein
MAREKLTIKDFDSRFSHEGNRLFFDDKEVQTEAHLTPKQTALAIAVAVFAILSAIATCTNAAITVWSTFFRKTPSTQTVGATVSNPDQSGLTDPKKNPDAGSGATDKGSGFSGSKQVPPPKQPTSTPNGTRRD